MGNQSINSLWKRIDNLELTPTESLVLTALAHYASDDFGHCHPRQEQLAKKTHLGLTAIKESLGSLKSKGLVRWTAKPKHPNEYVIQLGGANETDACGARTVDSSAESASATVEGAACTLLAYAFAALLADRKRRTDASVDFVRPVKSRGFLSAFRLFYKIKAQLRGLSDDEIHARILKRLADPEVASVA